MTRRRSTSRDWNRSSTDWAAHAAAHAAAERATKLLAGHALTAGERSEVLSAILAEVGHLDRLRSEGTLTPFGEGRIETLTTAYHKLNTEN